MADLVGRKIGAYEIQALLGEGGMGSVYRAHDPRLPRTVALKVMHTHLANQPGFQSRFRQEAQVAADLGDHPSIVTIHEFDFKDGQLYMVMEFISGGTLSDYIKRAHDKSQQIELSETLHILAQVADALDHAHRKGVVHRDIKPSNILLKRLSKPDREGEVPVRAVVTDFGLAKLREGGLHTVTGAFLGTFPYMSPEQCLGEELDGRSDVYSLGIVLYQLATGRLPFDIKTPQDAIRIHPVVEPPAPRAVWSGLPALVETAILRTIAKKPADRYQSAGQLADELRRLAGALTTTEITAYAPEDSVMSLSTQLQAEEPAVPPRRMDADQLPPREGDYVVIARGEDTPRSHRLDKPQLTIGRDAENDIALDDPNVSRKHARVERVGVNYTVTDLNSTNGTYLGEVKLLPNVSEVWTPNRLVRVGDTWLRLVRVGQQDTTTIHRADGSMVEPSQLRSSAGEGRITVFMEPADLVVEPGGACVATLTVLNRGRVVDHFRFSVVGVPAQWVVFSQPVVQLMPGGQQPVTLTIQPPRISTSRAGRYPLTIRVASQAQPDQVVELKATLTVSAYTQFVSEMRPQRIRAGQPAQVVVHNQGNAPHSFSLSWQDREEALAFEPAETRLNVPGGESAAAEFRARPRRRRWVGGVQVYFITNQVSSPDGQSQPNTGEVVSKGLLPFWLPPLFVVLCLAFTGAAAFLLNEGNKQKEATEATTRAEEVARTQGTATAVVLALANATATAQAQNATTEFVAGANQATIEAATATAIWLDGDDDRDGLTNRDELRLNTLPAVRDTDEDGLADGVEVNQWTTDPLDDDSDDDGLKDGAEVSMGINPLNADTDGDGTPDASDPDPGQVPSPTPDQAATAAAAATQTAVVQAAADATAAAQAAATATAQAQATATAQAATATAQAEAIARFVGNWTNVDANTGGMTRLVIEKVDDNTVAFHGYGKCTPSDCDWDAAVDDPVRRPSSVPFTLPQLVGVYEFGFKTTRITVERSGDQLVAEVFDDYSLADGRTDRTEVYVMERQPFFFPIITLPSVTLVAPVFVIPTATP